MFVRIGLPTGNQQVMPDDHSRLVPLLPIPNRTVKRFCANDSADPSVKVGYRQASIKNKIPPYLNDAGGFAFYGISINEPAIVSHDFA